MQRRLVHPQFLSASRAVQNSRSSWSHAAPVPHRQPLGDRATRVKCKPRSAARIPVTVRLWDVEAGQPACDGLTGHVEAARAVDFSPDGTPLVGGSLGDSVRFWRL